MALFKYEAFEVFEGEGDTYRRIGVFQNSDVAQETARRFAAKVFHHFLKKKSDLEHVLQDELTVEQAAGFQAPVIFRRTKK